MEFFQKFKLIDVVSFVLIIRALYTAVKYGLISEGINWCGVLCGAFFSFQYYPSLLKRFEKVIQQDYLHFLSFWILLTALLLLFFILRRISLLLLHRDEISRAERWAAVPLAGVRSALLISVLIYGFHLAPATGKLFDGSASQAFLKNFSVQTYRAVFKGYRRIRPDAVENKEVSAYYETEDAVRRDSKKGDRGRSARQRSDRSVTEGTER